MERNQIILDALKIHAQNELSRRDFWVFCKGYDPAFFQGRAFLSEIAEAFQKLSDDYDRGITTNISASLAPRAGKSYITSLFCAWWLGNHPTLCIMRNTVTSALYRKFSYDVRNIIKDRKYKAVFPKIELANDKQNIDGWALTSSKQGAYFGGGVGTNIIGFGANLAITDDLYSGFMQALSETYNESVFMWKQGSHDSRMEKGCPEIFIGTRWSKRDVIGKAIESKRVSIVIKIPALNEDGETFCSAVKSTEEYLKIKADVDEMIWEAEYQQEPIEAKGLMFPIDRLKKFNAANFDMSKSEYSHQSIDPANKGGDFFAGVELYLQGEYGDLFLMDVIYNKDGSDKNNERCRDNIISKKIQSVDYEGVFAWMETAKALRKMVHEKFEDCSFRIIKPTTNKQTRILAESAFIINHVHFREDWEKFPEYKKFMFFLTTYLKNQEGNKAAEHDDAPDVLSMAASHFRKKFSHLY